MTSQDDRVRCFTKNGGGTSHLARRRFIRAWDVHGEWSCLCRCRGALDVFRNGQIAAPGRSVCASLKAFLIISGPALAWQRERTTSSPG